MRIILNSRACISGVVSDNSFFARQYIQHSLPGSVVFSCLLLSRALIFVVSTVCYDVIQYIICVIITTWSFRIVIQTSILQYPCMNSLQIDSFSTSQPNTKTKYSTVLWSHYVVNKCGGIWCVLHNNDMIQYHDDCKILQSNSLMFRQIRVKNYTPGCLKQLSFLFKGIYPCLDLR